ncbi:MAG TPA: hypothetical protein VFR21_29330, partial [Bradyrhizobium sp.]|nr:hypothetical protein [Bradyrhizobium sp.]
DGLDLAAVDSDVPQRMVVQLPEQQSGMPPFAPSMEIGPKACERRADRGRPKRTQTDGPCRRE